MLFFGGALGVLGFFVWLFCIFDVITTPNHQVRNLPKLLWLLIVILLVDLGSVAWLLAGRHWGAKDGPGLRDRLRATESDGNDRFAARPQRVPRRGPARPSNPDDDAEFLATLDARVQEQRRRAQEQRDDPPAGS